MQLEFHGISFTAYEFLHLAQLLVDTMLSGAHVTDVTRATVPRVSGTILVPRQAAREAHHVENSA